MTQKSLPLTFGQRGFPAKTSRLLEWGQDLGFEAASLDCFMTLCASLESVSQELLSSKTCTGFSLATEDATSPSYSKRWTNSGMAWHGVCLTVKTLESPSNAGESLLLPCIETQKVQEKYFLSQNAAIGILRRVDRMKRNLPLSFRRSLEMLAKGPSSKA